MSGDVIIRLVADRELHICMYVIYCCAKHKAALGIVLHVYVCLRLRLRSLVFIMISSVRCALREIGNHFGFVGGMVKLNIDGRERRQNRLFQLLNSCLVIL